MITYKFITQNKSQDIEAMSLKKAMISFNTKAGDAKEVVVEWKSRKNNINPWTTIVKQIVTNGVSK